MIRSITKLVAALANTETIVEALTGRKDVPRKIVKIAFEQTADMDLRCYLDQDRIVDAASECEQFDSQFVEVDLDLLEGGVFKVGFANSTGGTLSKHITIFYTEG